MVFKVIFISFTEFSFLISVLNRDKNGKYKGLAGEVHYNEVDTSVGGLMPTLERLEAVDFTQGVFKSIKAVMIKTPLKTDASLRYFYLGELIFR